MKKLLAILLAAMMVFVLAACGSPTAPEEGLPNLTDILGEDGILDLDEILNGNGAQDILYGELDPATQQAIIDAAKQDGVNIAFGSDGNMIVEDADGSVIVQQPDGSWVTQDGNGGTAQLGGKWPDNEYTKQIPKPDMELFAVSTDDYGFSATFLSATLDQARDYAAELKAAGFTKNATTEDYSAMGMEMYVFTATNGAGYTAEVTFVSGAASLTISK